jgi:hypothetical protein
MDHKWKQIILAVLFDLRVNEIPNKTFILNSHWPFIWSAIILYIWQSACQSDGLFASLRLSVCLSVFLLPVISSLSFFRVLYHLFVFLPYVQCTLYYTLSSRMKSSPG